MSKFASLILSSILIACVGTPLTAQPLPIQVDQTVSGPQPVVDSSNGVPLINIAPPSAGGVSNNHYTHFNVGTPGAVLNNSGASSQTQLAGQVAGNPMLGSQSATTIINQVTTANPTQLLGPLEVAGNRANVIIANPAGITCNGCGFVNADRATLTTGQPQVGPEGDITLAVAKGRIRVEGQGLQGAQLNQLDLFARSVEVNAGIWADQLNVVAGTAKVDYASNSVSAQAGEGRAPALALDTSELGGMYANSIRLIGTEAGVGVNIAGNLTALTGDLQLNAAGDVSIRSSGSAHAARDLEISSARDLQIDGSVHAGNQVQLDAGRDAAINGLASSDGALDINARSDLRIGAQASLLAQGALQVIAGQDLYAAGTQVSSDDAVDLHAGRDLQLGTASVVAPLASLGEHSAAPNVEPRSVAPAAAATRTVKAKGQSRAETLAQGVISAKGPVHMRAGRDALLPGLINAGGEVRAVASGDLRSDSASHVQSARDLSLRAGGNLHWAGSAVAGGAMHLAAQRDLQVTGNARAIDGALRMVAARDLTLGASSNVQGQAVFAEAGMDLDAAGQLVSAGDLGLTAGRDARFGGRSIVMGNAVLGTTRNLRMTAAAQWNVAGQVSAQSGADMSLAGALQANGDMRLVSAADMSLDGQIGSQAGSINATAGGDFSAAEQARVTTAGRLGVAAAERLRIFGELRSAQDLSLQAGRNALVDGLLYAAGNLDLRAQEGLELGQTAYLHSAAAMQLRAGEDLSLKGKAVSEAGMTLNAQRDLRVAGTAQALGAN